MRSHSAKHFTLQQPARSLPAASQELSLRAVRSAHAENLPFHVVKPLHVAGHLLCRRMHPSPNYTAAARRPRPHAPSAAFCGVLSSRLTGACPVRRRCRRRRGGGGGGRLGRGAGAVPATPAQPAGRGGALDARHVHGPPGLAPAAANAAAAGAGARRGGRGCRAGGRQWLQRAGRGADRAPGPRA